MKEIILTRGGYAQVDDDDFDSLSKHRWYLHSSGYAVRTVKVEGKRTVLRMHNVILPPPDGFQVDHINGRRSDNQRDNLRLCTRYQNILNRAPRKESRLKGVELRGTRRWRATIGVNGQHIRLGTFDSERAAALAYDAAARKHFGDFARLNYPDEIAA